MAIYNLFDGGNVRHYGCDGCGCSENTDDLPLKLQPDLRVDGGYGFRHIKSWQSLMVNLEAFYNKRAKDLKVGDKLRIFVQPNHATMKNVFVDFNDAPNGFAFNLKMVKAQSFTAKKYENQYDEDGKVINTKETQEVTDMNELGGETSERSQISFVFADYFHNADVDAVELEIKSLPSGGLTRDLEILFARRFEMDGVHMF